MIAGIRRAFIGCEDGHAVAALCESIGQAVGRVGHAAGLGAAGRRQMGGQYGDFHSRSSVISIAQTGPVFRPQAAKRGDGPLGVFLKYGLLNQDPTQLPFQKPG